MESVLRKFGLKKGEHRETETRQKLQKELFAFNTCVEHGFPNKASAVGYDPQLGLLSIGTKTGALRIYGAPGVQLSGQHADSVAVLHIFFIGQGRLVTLCTDNCLHLWEIGARDGVSFLKEAQSLPFENRVKNVSASCLITESDLLLLGTENAHIYTVDLKSFKFLDQVIYQESVMQNAPDNFKVNPGAVESIVLHPTQQLKILIGYNRGLIAIWNLKQHKTEQIYNTTLQLECVTVHRSGKEFMTSHANGSYAIWSMSDNQKPKAAPNTPYGPFPCKAIHKMQWKTTKGGGHTLMVFSGGMPRASYGDHHTVTVMHGTRHIVFDFTSKVVDFFTICSADEVHIRSKYDYDDPHTLVVLVEEEVIFIDLRSEGWPVFRAPYLATLHSSAITCTAHVTNVPKTMWTKLLEAGNQQMSLGFSSEEWPIQGGVNLKSNITNQDLLITGHEDGSVRFWDVSTTDISLMYKLTTANIFGLVTASDEVSTPDLDEEWPPFRKIGTYDPFSDDPRLAVQKIVMCPLSEMLIIGGTAGQVIVMQFERDEHELDIHRVCANLIGDRDNFIWKGHDALPLKREVKFQSGFQPVSVVQLNPPATITALALHSEWQLLSAGTAHGFTLIDYIQRNVVLTKCTLNANDITGVGESTMSRRKSFKKSLRESFRRLRSGRSQRQRRHGSKSDDTKMRPINSPRKGLRDSSSAGSRHRHMDSFERDTTKPIERQVEARSSEDVSGSIVRTLYFADTFLINAQVHTSTLWAGTNGGSVFIYQLTIPANGKRDITPVTCSIAKEIRLKHQAPVINICVIDRNAMPLPSPFEVQHERAKSPEMSGNHSVIICSEEQLKVFSLPSLGARDKVKLTAVEGTKVRKISYVNFRSRSDETYVECDLVSLTNLGEVQVFSIPNLRRQLKAECIKKDNIIGIGSCTFTQNGEAVYLSSPSEFSRFSVSAHCITAPMCVIRVPDESVKAVALTSIVSPRNSTTNRTTVQSRLDASDMPTSSSNAEDHTMNATDESVAPGDLKVDSIGLFQVSDGTTSHSTAVQSSNHLLTTQENSTTTVIQNTSERTVTHVSTNVQNITTNSQHVITHEKSLQSARDTNYSAILLIDDELDENSETFELEELRIVEEGDELTPMESYPLPFSLSRNVKVQPAGDIRDYKSSQNIISSNASSSSIFNQHQMSSHQTSSANRNGKVIASSMSISNPMSSPVDDYRITRVSANSGTPAITITEAVGESVTE